MNAVLIERIEGGAERSACALFAAAVGYSAYALLAAAGFQPQVGLLVAGAAALAYFPCSRLLALAADSQTRFELPSFTPGRFAFAEAPDELLLTDRLDSANELLLTEADRLDTASDTAGDVPLMLEDILPDLSPDSRVVRLFDRKAMRTPNAGHPASPAADRLSSKVPLSTPLNAPVPPDASQALSAALAELRRSLR